MRAGKGNSEEEEQDLGRRLNPRWSAHRRRRISIFLNHQEVQSSQAWFQSLSESIWRFSIVLSKEERRLCRFSWISSRRPWRSSLAMNERRWDRQGLVPSILTTTVYSITRIESGSSLREDYFHPRRQAGRAQCTELNCGRSQSTLLWRHGDLEERGFLH